MVELGELEKRHQDFSSRRVRIVAISNDDLPTAKLTQAKFPHLLIASDPEQKMAKALQVVQVGVGPGGADTNAPTTFVVDGAGNLQWLYRPDRFVVRLSPDQLITAIEQAVPGATIHEHY
jgi:peroxiredoxin